MIEKVGIYNPLGFEALKDHITHQVFLRSGMAIDEDKVVREVIEIRCKDCDVTLVGIGDDPVGLAVDEQSVALFCDEKKAKHIKAAYT